MPVVFPLPRFAACVAILLLSGCAEMAEREGPPRPETVFAVTAARDGGQALLRFNAGQPSKILARRPVGGLAPGDELVGIDFRVARGVLYALGRSGQLYTVDTATGALKAVGARTPLAVPMAGQRFGFDFNPAADRIRIVGDDGFNLRLHPDTGVVVDGDPARPGVQPDPRLAYAPGDPQAGQVPQVVAAAYTYNQRDEKLTTNYAIDRRLGTLVMQGSKEGAQPVVSPNTGRLTTVGPLGLGPLDDVSFDIADVSNAALAAVRGGGSERTRLVLVDLASGRAQVLGRIGDGQPLAGIAIEP